MFDFFANSIIRNWSFGVLFIWHCYFWRVSKYATLRIKCEIYKENRRSNRKHGPRSLIYMRVCEWKTHKRNESEYKMPTARGSIGLPWYSLKGMSKSMYVKTRKMTIYAWVGWSQEKFWWRLEQILTCKSFCELEYRGEKPIESSSSWFLLKFLSG